ncbi:gp6-like head-tail connector protein [Rhizobium sp. PP-CC-2G-626]|nr:gp6-like head-tail connector protein [Rhizobium sp. PP-CC-2G-626]
MTVINLEDAKMHLNVTDDTDDLLITDQIAAAEAFVGRWTVVPLSYMDPLPADLRQAVLMLTGHFYENREASLVGVSADAMPLGFWDLVTPHREWAF